MNRQQITAILNEALAVARLRRPLKPHERKVINNALALVMQGLSEEWIEIKEN